MKKILSSLLFCFFWVSTLAQECDPMDLGCEEIDAPLDSGVGLLIGAAALYTMKKLKGRKGTSDNIPGF